MTAVLDRCAPADRNYDPNTGTFLSPDPLDGVDGTPTGANPYHYADNDPLNRTDPLGLRPTDDDPFSGPDPERVGAMLDALRAIYDAGCTPLMLDRMRDYMFGTLRPPCGFQSWAYEVDFLTDIKAGSRIAVDPYGGTVRNYV